MHRSVAVVAAALVLSGCISFGEKPPAQLLRLTAAQTAPVGTAQSVAAGEAITVLPPLVSAELATNRVPVQATATTVAYVKDAQWVEPPNRLFARLIAETIEARTGRPVLSGRQFSFDPGTRITGELIHFGVDAASSSALVTFDAAVARGTAVQTRRFEARVPVAQIEAQAVGVALNQAANQVAVELADWIK